MGHYVEVEQDVKLFVEDIGEGQPVIFLHGWPVNHKMFEYQINDLVEEGYRFIGIDQRGYGKSDRPDSGYDYDRKADDVRAVIEYLQLEDAVLAGFSMGGPVALRYMARHKEYQISKLLLLAPAAPRFTKTDDFSLGIEKSEIDGMIESIKQDRPAFLKEFGDQFFYQEPSEPFKQWFGTLGLEASAHGTINSAQALRDEDGRSDLAAVNVPVLLLHGEKDEICPIDFSTLLEEQLANAKLIKIENSGHGFIFEQKEKVNQEILRFLKN
ncbi:alpha/beta fold hydrolase [Jeotgalibacillus proteolyticus]|uniref:Alpha/beta hydrolase n=1 Tax=Jeotgalibacillus proteolyticus TaxID=2082395 RepID=A0A2S5G9U3_9BACL|nr:alpha/beta hydrolase [Jeotgalibacillus proteolyticus]PPA69758.1 alpha/beta hydrolase [Jeotgalibacillus proteolyticus]